MVGSTVLALRRIVVNYASTFPNRPRMLELSMRSRGVLQYSKLRSKVPAAMAVAGIYQCTITVAMNSNDNQQHHCDLPNPSRCAASMVTLSPEPFPPLRRWSHGRRRALPLGVCPVRKYRMKSKRRDGKDPGGEFPVTPPRPFRRHKDAVSPRGHACAASPSLLKDCKAGHASALPSI